MWNYVFTNTDIEFCIKHAKLMCAGFKTYSFKNDIYQSEDVYRIGKLGELLVFNYLKAENFNVIHTPFRGNYDKLNFKDDFQVKNKEHIRQIEVRTKARSVNPKSNYECCLDCIKPALSYLFVSINRVNMVGHLLGWADWNCLSKWATETIKGTTNNNFTHKTTEFNIKIENLNNMSSFLSNYRQC